MYRGWVVLGRQKYREERDLCQSLAPLRLRLLLESWKSVSLQVLIRFQQNCFEQEGK
jgi:hypothetical protein